MSVCSLANEWSESLWKNYAENRESGFCICYNSDVLKQLFSGFYYGDVGYKGHTVWLNEIKDPLEVLLMKDKKWEDENEFRFTGINKVLQKDKNFTHVKKKKWASLGKFFNKCSKKCNLWGFC